MGIVVRYQPVGLTREKYDATNEQLESAGVEFPPDGLDVHVCFGEDGDLRVSEIWDSREQFNAFAEKLMPVLTDAGIEFAGDPEVYEIHELQKR